MVVITLRVADVSLVLAAVMAAMPAAMVLVEVLEALAVTLAMVVTVILTQLMGLLEQVGVGVVAVLFLTVVDVTWVTAVAEAA